MVLGRTAAYYGLFQLAFAEADEYLRTLLCHLRNPADPYREFPSVSRMSLSRVLGDLRKKLRQFAKPPGTCLEENASHIRRACACMRKLSVWRNSRIHPHARTGMSGAYLLFDKRAGQDLSMDETEIMERIDDAINVSTVVESNSAHLLDILDFTQEIQAMLSQERTTDGETLFAEHNRTL